MKIQKLSILYDMEHAVKEYRKMSNANIKKDFPDLTFDQSLALFFINDRVSQNDLSKLMFKDPASVARILEQLVKKRFLQRRSNVQDKRRFDYEITSLGLRAIRNTESTIIQNRAKALKGISEEEMKILELVLKKILFNCIEN